MKEFNYGPGDIFIDGVHYGKVENLTVTLRTPEEQAEKACLEAEIESERVTLKVTSTGRIIDIRPQMLVTGSQIGKNAMITRLVAEAGLRDHAYSLGKVVAQKMVEDLPKLVYNASPTGKKKAQWKKERRGRRCVQLIARWRRLAACRPQT